MMDKDSKEQHDKTSFHGHWLAIVLIICFRQYFNDKVQSETELSEHYNIPIMGTIPDMNVAEKGSSDYYYSYGGSSGEKAEPEEEDESKKGGRKS